MEANLHLQQGLILVNRILKFYPVMKEGNQSTVTLSDQDWIVLMDFIENPESVGMRPEVVSDMKVNRELREITIAVPDCSVRVVMGF